MNQTISRSLNTDLRRYPKAKPEQTPQGSPLNLTLFLPQRPAVVPVENAVDEELVQERRAVVNVPEGGALLDVHRLRDLGGLQTPDQIVLLGGDQRRLHVVACRGRQEGGVWAGQVAFKSDATRMTISIVSKFAFF